ncbi:MAG: diaminopimelate epimerase [Candidatus Omnitrophica bacterium]|nr:diaminopimelate epimerase [Candidatus Omnitrophota bacterium]
MKIELKKFSASGNTFYLLDTSKYSFDYKPSELARNVCLKSGKVDVDGLLIIEHSKNCDIKMRIFNPDGSEAEMCGNGARCVAFYLSRLDRKDLRIETMVGIIQAEVSSGHVRIKLTDPSDIKLNMPLEVNARMIHVSSIDTGVPHVVVFVNALSRIDVACIGAMIRNHERFAPRGTNVDFVEIRSFDSLAVRTYERGVESETLACGTGIVASVLISYRLSFIRSRKINVKPTSQELLTVEFEYEKGNFSDIWLEGRVQKLTGKKIEVS